MKHTTLLKFRNANSKIISFLYFQISILCSYLNFSLLVILLNTWLFTSCITNRDTVIIQTKGDKDYYQNTNYSEYKLQTNDRISYSIFSSDVENANLFSGNPAIGQNNISSNTPSTYRILPNGNVMLPFMGELQIKNLTLVEAEAKLKNRVKEYIPDAQVKLSLSSEYFFIMGYGMFPITKNRMTIIQALSSIDLKESTLDKKHFKIIRQTEDGNYLIKTIDLRSTEIIGSDYFFVKPNDIYYIPTSNKSFFNITTLSSFFSFIMLPVSVFLFVLNL